MTHNFTLRYWLDDGWYVGHLEEIPNVFSQGETMNELEKNIQEVYSLLYEDTKEAPITSKTKELELVV